MVLVQIVAEAAFTAIARKGVILDSTDYEPFQFQLGGIALIIAALAGTP